MQTYGYPRNSNTRRRRVRLAALIVSAVFCSAEALLGQPRTLLTDATICKTCSLQVHLVVSLGRGPQDDGLPSRPYANTIAVDGQGRFFVGFPETQDEPVWVFDRSGHLIRKLGRGGSGPGEFREVRAIRITRGDTLRVYDGTLGRVSVFAPNLGLVRTEVAPTRLWDIAWQDDGSAIISADLRTASTIGYPLHLINSDHKIALSFGTKNPVFFSRKRRQIYRWLNPVSGGFWASTYTNSYEVYRYAADAAETLSLERSANWFPRMEEYWFPTKVRAPAPEVWGVNQSGDSLLWVLARVGDPRWKEGLSAPIVAEGREIYRWTNYERVFDSIIEAVWLPSRSLISGRRFDGVLFALFGSDLAAMARETKDGDQYVEVYQIEFRRKVP